MKNLVGQSLAVPVDALLYDSCRIACSHRAFGDVETGDNALRADDGMAFDGGSLENVGTIPHPYMVANDDILSTVDALAVNKDGVGVAGADYSQG